MLSVFTAGLPESALRILNEALDKAFDGGSIEVKVLNEKTVRGHIRTSGRSNVALVVLDTYYKDLCEPISRGLYSDEKFYCYVNDGDFITYLNSKFDIDIAPVVTPVITPVTPSIDVTPSDKGAGGNDALVSYYEEKVRMKDGIIASLEARVKELSEYGYGGMDDSEELVSLRNLKVSLSNEILDLKTKLETDSIKLTNLNSKNAELESTVNSLRSNLQGKEDLLDRLNNNISVYEKKIAEFEHKVAQYETLISSFDTKESGYKSEISNLSSTLSARNKDIEVFRSSISRLEGEVDDYRSSISRLEGEAEGYRIENSRLVEENKKLEILSSNLKSNISSLEGKYSALEGAVGNFGSERESYESTIRGKDEKISSLESLVKELRGNVASLDEINSTHSTKIKELEDASVGYVDTIRRLEEENSSHLNTINSLESEKLDLESQKSSIADSSEIIAENNELKAKLGQLVSNVYCKIGMNAKSSSPIGASIIGRGISRRYSNVRFVFSGSSESRRGTYKAMLSSIKGKAIIVDLVAETYIDYVFEVGKVVSCVDWFSRGGSITPYLSYGKRKDIGILTPGLGFINDSYFLSIDWVSRLDELEKLGCEVYVYCGDLSSLVSRVLYESFVGLGSSVVYVLGNIVSSRSVLTNMMGLEGAKNSVIAYIDYTEHIKAFYEKMCKSNKCVIVSRSDKR